MKIDILIDENELRKMIFNRLNELLPDADLKEEAIKIEVKSKQNYKAEWELASFRATIKEEI